MRVVHCLVGCAVPRRSCGAMSCRSMTIICAHSVDNDHIIQEIYRHIGKTTDRYMYLSIGPKYDVLFLYPYRYTAPDISYHLTIYRILPVQ